MKGMGVGENRNNIPRVVVLVDKRIPLNIFYRIPIKFRNKNITPFLYLRTDRESDQERH